VARSDESISFFFQIDTISIYFLQNIGDIDISAISILSLLYQMSLGFSIVYARLHRSLAHFIHAFQHYTND
jgi:hypothetical protein